MRAIYHWIRTEIIKLNLFESEASLSDIFHLRTAIISTRIYLALLISAITILIFFISLESQTKIVTIEKPSETIYEDLYNKYSSTLECPCNNIAIPYSLFISISPQYHPVCSSSFVSDEWINFLSNRNMTFYLPIDFRSSGSGHFQILASLCLQTMRSVDDAIDDFFSDTLLTSNVISRQDFQEQSQVDGLFVQTSTVNAFGRLFRLVRNITKINALQTALQTSMAYLFMNDSTFSDFVYGHPPYFAESPADYCYCGISSACILPSSFYSDYFYGYPREYTYAWFYPHFANVTEFKVGCYAIESLLQSSLECFFDQTCLSTVLTYFPQPNNSAFITLAANQTHFDPQTPIEILVNLLFLERWSIVSSFSAYYVQCAPIACTYTFTERNNGLYVLIKLLSLYGGITVVLRFIVPQSIAWWRNRAVRRMNLRQVNVLHVSLAERFRLMWAWIRVQIIELNLFGNGSVANDPYELITSRIATRVYLLCLSLSILVLVIYTTSDAQTPNCHHPNPSEMTLKDLKQKYPITIQCPCKQIIIQYGSFISLSPQYHPVCTSLFVSDEWIYSVHGRYEDNSFQAQDFQQSSPDFFRGLATLCSLTQATLSDAWQILNKSSLVTSQALTDDELIDRMHTLFSQFESNIVAEFKSSLTLIQSHSRNMLVSRYKPSFGTPQMSDSSHRIDFLSLPQNLGNCSCALNDECLQPIGLYSHDYYDFYDSELMLNIPNFFLGCTIINGILQSSLECFFDQECLDTVQWTIISQDSVDMPILQPNATRFLPSTPIGILLDSLMIEQLGEIIQYDRYYAQCAPKLCTFTYPGHNNALYIFTLLISLFGGLTVALKFIVLGIVGFVRNRMRPNVPEMMNIQPVRRSNCLFLLWQMAKTKLLELNFFKNEVTQHDNHRRRSEILATRIYIFCFIILIVILVTYRSLIIETKYYTLDNPSKMSFEQLQSNPQYSSTLKCPCHTISIPYSSFISMSPYFHQFCSSDFILNSSSWLNLLFYREAILNYSYFDYRLFAVPQFQWLNSLCRLANETVVNALIQFGANTFVTKYALSQANVEIQATTAISQFRREMPRRFVRMLDLIRNMSQGNGIVSSTMSNWQFFLLIRNVTHSYLNEDQTPDDSLFSEPRVYGKDGNCSCSTNAMCTSTGTLDGQILPGFLVGCESLEALLQSTLECLYNLTCINVLKNMYFSSNLSIRPLNVTLSSPNTTVQSLVNVFMIDRWEQNIIYDQYYSSCAPLQCSYSLNERVNLVYVVTVITGLFGGLSVVLKLLVPILVKIVRHIQPCRQRTVVPMAAARTVEDIN